jgi:hypothetical protein
MQLGIPVRYLLKHPHAVAELTSDPGDIWARLRESYLGAREWRFPPFPYETDPDWERELHALDGCGVAVSLRERFLGGLDDSPERTRGTWHTSWP